MKEIEVVFRKIEREAIIFCDYISLRFYIVDEVSKTTYIDSIAGIISYELKLSKALTKEIFEKAFENVLRKYKKENRKEDYLIFDIYYEDYSDKLEILERIKEITTDVETSLELAMYEIKELKKKYDMTNYIIKKMQFDPHRAKFVRKDEEKEADENVIL